MQLFQAFAITELQKGLQKWNDEVGLRVEQVDRINETLLDYCNKSLLGRHESSGCCDAARAGGQREHHIPAELVLPTESKVNRQVAGIYLSSS